MIQQVIGRPIQVIITASILLDLRYYYYVLSRAHHVYFLSTSSSSLLLFILVHAIHLTSFVPPFPRSPVPPFI